ncbi:SAG-related sequence [Besnoitia besnoiti]|uniref:SAG-related sequence n=1 Tax=Besnoitia besnoiti TaxID=94643 RepID=A0A2A9MBH3_BESBE|nr:SAG-related sequence [Besnoitia besnoiti]PFH32967.1 SAG-related sequence [Besnoitia besnoiti]
MKLSLASLGATVAITFCLGQANGSLRDSQQQLVPDPLPAPTETRKCAPAKKLELMISEPKETAAFICPTTLPVLDPEYAEASVQKVYLGKEVKNLREILTDATLIKTTSTPQSNGQGTKAAASQSADEGYTLTVPQLPHEKTTIAFKCKPQNGEKEEQLEGKGTPAEACEVFITVASSGTSAALQTVSAATAIIGFLSAATNGVL